MKMFFFVLIGIILGFLAVFAAYVLLMTISAYVIKPVEYDHNSPYYRFLLNISLAMLFFVCRIHIETNGMENVPQGTRFLLVSNHRSKFDPMAVWLVFKKYDIGFISKEENFKIPWFGRIIRKCCCLAIDRNDPGKAVATVEKASELLKKDAVSVGVYPEGTRSLNCELLPFHNAVFKIAQRAEVPIVVITTEGTENIHRNYIRKRTDIRINVIDVISREEVRQSRGTAALGRRIREDMLYSLDNQNKGDDNNVSHFVQSVV